MRHLARILFVLAVLVLAPALGPVDADDVDDGSTTATTNPNPTGDSDPGASDHNAADEPQWDVVYWRDAEGRCRATGWREAADNAATADPTCDPSNPGYRPDPPPPTTAPPAPAAATPPPAPSCEA